MRPSPAATTVLLLLVGCGPDTGEVPCRPGFALAGDGHCYPPPPDPTPPTANDVLENLAPCVPDKPDDAIDLATGCIDGACAGTQFEAVNAALGEGVVCEEIEGEWFCTWPQQIAALFPIGEDDGPRPARDAYTPFVRAVRGYEGADATGLGLGISPRCWIDVLGGPTTAEFVDTAGRLQPRQLVWASYGIEIEDEEDARGVDLPNGEIDELTLFGPP